MASFGTWKRIISACEGRSYGQSEGGAKTEVAARKVRLLNFHVE